MPVVICIFEIKWDDSRTYKKIYDSLVAVLSKGRPETQITFDRSTCFLSTPESAKSVSKRIEADTYMRPNTDDFIMIDLSSKSVLIWGSYSEDIEIKFNKFGPLNFERISKISK
jgi:hypothetical protein